MSKLTKNMNVDTGEKTWLTPKSIIDALGSFDLDPCCPPQMPWSTAAEMICRPANGLEVDWLGKRVWCNPPYGREAVPFLQKMALQRQSGGGIVLIFARTDTLAWQKWIFPFAYGILFVQGRIRFYRTDGTPGETAPAPSALVAYSEKDLYLLRYSGIQGALVSARR